MKSVVLFLVLLPLPAGSAIAAGTDAHDHGTAAAHAAVDHGQVDAASTDEFSTFDADHDGVLSRREMARHPKAAHMAMVDGNRDGVLDREEFAELSGM